uniref:Uncharacterized protein n=1 Tax=Parascaris univalens TaxID=6257 RepID=A0A915ACF8_PARUN
CCLSVFRLSRWLPPNVYCYSTSTVVIRMIYEVIYNFWMTTFPLKCAPL